MFLFPMYVEQNREDFNSQTLMLIWLKKIYVTLLRILVTAMCCINKGDPLLFMI
jgi:hypothetical protein